MEAWKKGVRYKHTNIIAKNWRSLSEFYVKTFGCIRVPPERHLSGNWLDKGIGIKNAKFSGVHLRLPGHGKNGPTLEIYQYSRNEEELPSVANREGYRHIAFEVDDVEVVMARVLKNGGQKVGEVTSLEIRGLGILTFVYVADPEGNIIELQKWAEGS